LLNLFTNGFLFLENRVPKLVLKVYQLFFPTDVRNHYDTDVPKCFKNLRKLILQRVWIHKYRCPSIEILCLNGVEVDALVQQDQASILFVHVTVPSYVDVKQHILVALVTLEKDTFCYRFIEKSLQLVVRIRVVFVIRLVQNKHLSF